MITSRFKHTRSSGKRLTYDVEVSGSAWTIFLNGKELANSGNRVDAGGIGAVTGDTAGRVWAISTIEQLLDMPEE
ncbi:hypothetical protein [Xylophilus ampelinus]|uniref:hypothetical protein n=1 Tax=Xylophilus ampelinus TaxID=54067 RepID=UPI0011B5A65C|nr:hypothetical protein [Xylophilus ampelinus]MCS4509151.1 hypothetical protein [Xylophilus ampelinus]